MSFVIRTTRPGTSTSKTPADVKKTIAKRKWKTVEIKISEQDLDKYIDFLDDAVVIRSGPEGMPLMTTTAIYGPIRPGTRVALNPLEGIGVRVISENCTGETLIDQLEALERNAPAPKEGNAVTVHANWVSGKDGGIVPGLDTAANVFGGTGSLYVNDTKVSLPVLDVTDPDYDQTLAFYGAKRLKPNEEFCMGFKLPLFGMEYNTSLPDYIRNYALSPLGGGGLFVEHHPFPHIFMPKPTKDMQIYCEAKVTLGHKVKDPKDHIPQVIFTTFRVPSDGSALVIKPSAIHNDSFTNGRLAVFVADVPTDEVDTVAFRDTSPYKNISVKDK